MTPTPTAALPTPVEPDAETTADVADRAAFEALVGRLSRQSVEKNFDPFVDIAWDDPDYAIDPTDPRWVAVVGDGLRATEWFRALPAEKQSELGLCLVAGFMKIGLQFESVLKRGLLEYAVDLPNGDPTFRYAYHEVIEEAHHSLMFQEFVDRSGLDLPGLPWHLRLGTRRIVRLGRWFPELFFMFVLGGEDPIDHVQREGLRSTEEHPPILDRISRIHVTEEARHLSFARHFLKQRVPHLGRVRRAWLSLQTPVILGVMAQLMMRPPDHVVRRFDIPADVVATVYRDDPTHRQRTIDSLRKIRRLSRELGLINPVSRRVWMALGIWDED